MTAVLSFISNIHALWLCMDNLWLFNSDSNSLSNMKVTHCHCFRNCATIKVQLRVHSPHERTSGMGTAREKISITRCTCIIIYNNLLLIWRFISLGQYFKILSAWIQSLWKLWLVLDWLFLSFEDSYSRTVLPSKSKS